MNWATRSSDLITRNWREKLVALVLAFLFWLLIKAQTERPPMPYWQQMPPPAPLPAVKLRPSSRAARCAGAAT